MADGILTRRGNIENIGGSSIKSIQSLYLNGENVTKTIDEIDPINSILLCSGIASPSSKYNGTMTKLWIKNSTTVEMLTSENYAVSVVVIEFEPSAVKSKQSGAVSIVKMGEATVDISPVNPSKCIATAYYMFDDNTDDWFLGSSVTALTETSITIRQTGVNYNSSSAKSIYWEVIELR